MSARFFLRCLTDRGRWGRAALSVGCGHCVGLRSSDGLRLPPAVVTHGATGLGVGRPPNRQHSESAALHVGSALEFCRTAIKVFKAPLDFGAACM